jgi:hypothetical protein
MGLLVSGKNAAALKTAERSYFTSTAGQTTFTIPGGYAIGEVDVFLNGIRLVDADDYFAINGSTIVLSTGANLGDSLVVVCYYQFQATGHYTKSESDSRYLSASATTPLTSFLRTPNYGVSSTSDSLSAELTAAAVGQQGVGVKAYGRSMSTVGGDLHMIADSRGAGGGHKFYSWNGTTLTTVATIDSAGRMTRPQTPCFDVASSVGAADGSVQTYNTTWLNIGGSFSNNRFTAPVTGNYLFNAATIKNNSNASAVGRLYLRKNGTTLYNSRHLRLSEGSSYGDGSCTWIVQLNANDYVDVFMNGNAGSHASVEYTWFNGFLIG